MGSGLGGAAATPNDKSELPISLAGPAGHTGCVDLLDKVRSDRLALVSLGNRLALRSDVFSVGSEAHTVRQLYPQL